jgi:hypothetical protein
MITATSRIFAIVFDATIQVWSMERRVAHPPLSNDVHALAYIGIAALQRRDGIEFRCVTPYCREWFGRVHIPLMMQYLSETKLIQSVSLTEDYSFSRGPCSFAAGKLLRAIADNDELALAHFSCHFLLSIHATITCWICCRAKRRRSCTCNCKVSTVF